MARFLEDEDHDPMLSVVNLIDLFLVIIGVLMVQLSQNAMNPSARSATPADHSSTRITIKEGKELVHYESTGQVGEGKGARAGVTYRLEDGRMIYVPED